MGRKRKLIIKMPKAKIPKLFDCPNILCGRAKSVRVAINRKEKEVSVKCGYCSFGIALTIHTAIDKDGIKRITEHKAIDYFNEAIDQYEKQRKK